MGMTFFNRRVLSIILVIILLVLVTSSQLGVSCRPLQDELFDGLILQLLPRGTPSKPSTPNPKH
jgi:hypothetical protein